MANHHRYLVAPSREFESSAQLVQTSPGRAQAAESIEEQPDAHPAGGSAGQLVDDGAADLIAPQHEGAERQRIPRIADQRHQRLERLPAVRMEDDRAVAGGRWHAERCQQAG